MQYTGNRKHGIFSAQYLVRLSVLVAILLFLEISGLGIIKTPGIEFTIMQVPVIIGAITMGPAAGGILGGVFGFISFWECFGRSAFGAILLSIHPAGTFLVCVPTRILMGILCGLIFQLLKRIDKTGLWSFGAASLAGALLNTLFFMAALVIFFYPTDYIQGFVQMLGVANPFAFVLAFVGVQGLLEAVICFLAGAAISKALYRTMQRK